MLSTEVTKIMFVTEAEYKRLPVQPTCMSMLYVMQNYFSMPLQVHTYASFGTAVFFPFSSMNYSIGGAEAVLINRLTKQLHT
jgi:hypothetical protein